MTLLYNYEHVFFDKKKVCPVWQFIISARAINKMKNLVHLYNLDRDRGENWANCSNIRQIISSVSLLLGFAKIISNEIILNYFDNYNFWRNLSKFLHWPKLYDTFLNVQKFVKRFLNWPKFREPFLTFGENLFVTIVLLLIVQAWRIWTFENPDAHRCHHNSHVAVREQEKTFFDRALLYSHSLYYNLAVT